MFTTDRSFGKLTLGLVVHINCVQTGDTLIRSTLVHLLTDLSLMSVTPWTLLHGILYESLAFDSSQHLADLIRG